MAATRQTGLPEDDGIMRILVCGAHGFIGRHLCAALDKAGHEVVRGVRTPTAADEIAIDFARDVHVGDWSARLEGIGAVINAVGILRERQGQTFDAVHRAAPIALFDACEAVGVRRVIQVSTLSGVDEGNPTPFMRTKREADAHLMQSALDWSILRPSLVVGMDGASSTFFRMLASMPLIGLPGRGEQMVQPLHIGDLCAAVLRLLEPSAPKRTVIHAVGPEPMRYRAMLQAYRTAMHLPAPQWLTIPMPFMRCAARLAALLPGSVLSPGSLRMLADNNVADSQAFAQLLGREPQGASAWFAGASPDMLRAQAICGWAIPLLRIALALVWIVTGLLSLDIYPLGKSLALLAPLGLHGAGAHAVLIAAALLDLGMGLATLIAPCRLLWRLQFILIAGYTAIISAFLPAYWLHPFGPILKNIPILALLLVLDAFEAGKK